MNSKKRNWLISIVVILALVTGGIVFYLRENVLMPREAQLFFELVDKEPASKKCFDAMRAVVKHPRCLGSQAVKSEVLDRLTTATNRDYYYYLSLFQVLSCIHERGVMFKDTEWSAIRNATAQHGEFPDHGVKFHVTTNNGRPFLGAKVIGDMGKSH
jgi:hypothetical protein